MLNQCGGIWSLGDVLENYSCEEIPWQRQIIEETVYWGLTVSELVHEHHMAGGMATGRQA